MTGYQTLKQSNYLITISLYRDPDKALAHRDGKYCAIPGGPPGQLPCKLPGSTAGWASPGNVTSLNPLPLGLRGKLANQDLQPSKARVWLMPNTCFFATKDYYLMTIF